MTAEAEQDKPEECYSCGAETGDLSFFQTDMYIDREPPSIYARSLSDGVWWCDYCMQLPVTPRLSDDLRAIAAMFNVLERRLAK